MILERSEHPDWLSNTYLVANGEGEPGCFIDAGGPVQPLIDKARQYSLEITDLFLTHRHFDHVAELSRLVGCWPAARVWAHPDEAADIPVDTSPLVGGERLEVGRLAIEVLHTPGHTSGMVALLIGGNHLFTGDTLFRGSVGGIGAPDHTTFADIRRSVMDVLLKLPHETEIHPGHTEPTTVAAELAENPFVLAWRGAFPEGDDLCLVNGQTAQLIVLADDYDGGKKAWIRWPDGRDDLVPGSRLTLSDR